MKVDNWIKLRKNRFLNKIIAKILMKKGLDLPFDVKIGKNVSFVHNAVGTVIHNSTIIHNNVRIYNNVTIGRKDIYITQKKIEGIEIMEGAIICAGARILAGDKKLIIGKHSIIAANAVLLNSVGEYEVWGGIPARLLKKLDITKE